MILRGGYNIYPRELEEVIMTHEAVSLSRRSASACRAKKWARKSKPSNSVVKQPNAEEKRRS
jgi:acyl-CoA synthetase (AMP-forming)/AMP-acid ligase II